MDAAMIAAARADGEESRSRDTTAERHVEQQLLCHDARGNRRHVDRGGSVKPRTPRTTGARYGVGVLAACLVLSGGCGAAIPAKDAAAPARKPDFVLTKDQTHTKFSRRIAPRIRVPSGSIIEAFTHEATGGQVTSTSTVDDTANLDWDRIHTLTGPVYVEEGAEPGDVLAVRLLELEPDDWGVVEDGEPPGFRVSDR